MKKIIFLILSLALVLSGCGGETAETVPALQEGEALTLTQWSMNATLWSSPNGATVNLTAVPNGYVKDQTAEFVVRLEGEEAAAVNCTWDGTAYKASADLNAADGYCYYVRFTDAEGAALEEIPVNTPNNPTDNSLVNLKTALDTYCTVTVEESGYEGGKLRIHAGTAVIQMPWLTLETGPVTCKQASLILSHNGQDIIENPVAVSEPGNGNVCHADLSNITFAIPDSVEDDHQLKLRLEATLSNGYKLTSAGTLWYYFNGELLPIVG